MKNQLIKTAFTIIEQETNTDYRIVQAKKLIAQIKKDAGLFDYLKNPLISTIMSLLTPLMGSNYRIQSAVKLLLEALSEAI